MALKTDFIKKSGVLIASVTSGYTEGSNTVRDSGGCVLGHTASRFNTTRDSNGKLVSTNSADPGLLIRKK